MCNESGKDESFTFWIKLWGKFFLNLEMHLYSLITQILPSVEYVYIDELTNEF